MEGTDPDQVTRVIDSPSPIDSEATGSNHAASPELPLGSSFGRYVVVRTLGQGGMGMVYLAYDPQLDRGVALKVLRPGARSVDRDAAQARLLREAQAMARLSHPNVLPVYDVGMVDAHVFVAMEYVDGQTLGQWRRAADRPWSEVLDVFMGAGRGLAAAHEAGLVHRDFKPDNVLLGEHARPRVMDFGLARAAEDEPHHSVLTTEISGPQSDHPSGPLSGPLSDMRSGPRSISGSSSAMDALTRSGFVLGTPAYMAPEQHFGAAPDPLSDQFSFCVALYEALYGARPFTGDTGAALCRAALSRRVRPAPAGTRVPAGLRRVVLRGLSPDTEDRWPSMDALLTALARYRRRASPWRHGATSLGVLGITAGVVGIAGPWSAAADSLCEGGEQALAEIWHEGSQRAVRNAFERTGLAFAEDAADRTIDRLDAWGRAWTNEHRQACEATHVRHEQSGTALDLRMRCLAQRRRALTSLHEVLVTAERGTVENALAAVERLPGPDDCADLEALQAEVAPPTDPGERARVDDLQATLGRVDALLVAARFDEARAAFDEARLMASGIEHPPAWVELGAREAHVLQTESSLPEAVYALERTLWQAEAEGMDRMAITLAADLMWLDGAENDEHARGQTWTAMAEAKLERLGPSPRLQAYVLRRRGDFADRQGHYDEAARYFTQALELRERHEPGSVAYGRALGDFGKIHYRAGRIAQAARTFEHARSAMIEALGPDHPDIAKLAGNAAAMYHILGDYDRAREGFESSLQLLERAYGPDHLAVATALTNLGNLHYRQGHYTRAVEIGRRAVRIKEANLGPGHPKVGANLNNVAMALSKQGHHEQALAAYRDAEASLVKLGPEHIDLVEPRIGQGEELLHLSQPAQAIIPLRAAYDLERAHGHDPRRRALPAFLLARALWDSGLDGDRDRARARELATDGLRVLGDEPETAEQQRLARALRDWLAEHPSP
ncbi:MAG: serine/threonine-protein kinase [Myxococcota bacterium]